MPALSYRCLHCDTLNVIHSPQIDPTKVVLCSRCREAMGGWGSLMEDAAAIAAIQTGKAKAPAVPTPPVE